MNIIIFGASGATGHELVNQALTQGHFVTAFVRNPAKLNIVHHHLKIIEGDIIHYPIVEAAIKGQDAVISSLGAASPFKFDQTVVDGVQNIIKAMEKTRISRFIYLSFVGVKESRNTAGFVIKYIAPRLLSTEIAGHEKREKMIKQSSLEWTIIRAPTLTNGKHLRQFRSGEGISSKGFTVIISRADVADFMLQQFESNNFIRKSPSVMY
ncbi:MAG: SDR family oxidoreductase [Saprospiraceae bacterium]